MALRKLNGDPSREVTKKEYDELMAEVKRATNIKGGPGISVKQNAAGTAISTSSTYSVLNIFTVAV